MRTRAESGSGATVANAFGTRRRRFLGAIAASVSLGLGGCAGTAPPDAGTRPDPPATWRDPFGPRFTVVLDPGHGGRDTGSRGDNGLLEKDLTLDLAERVATRLADIDGIDVALTRDRDVWLPREARVAAVRDAGADLLLSLHFNDLPERHIALVETYYAHALNIVDSRTRRRVAGGAAGPVDPDEPADVSFTRGSERIAALVQRHVFAAVEAGNPRAVDAGVKRDTLFVLTRGFTSGALIELTCLSNAREAERLAGDDYLEELAEALVTAIEAYRRQSNVLVPTADRG